MSNTIYDDRTNTHWEIPDGVNVETYVEQMRLVIADYQRESQLMQSVQDAELRIAARVPVPVPHDFLKNCTCEGCSRKFEP